MKQVLLSKHFWVAVILCSLFWVLASFLPNHTVLLVSNSLVLIGSIAVALVYMPVAWSTLTQDKSDRLKHISLGIAYVWGFSALWKLWILIFLTSGQPYDWINNDIVGFFQAGIFLGAIYHLTAPGTVDGVPTKRLIGLGVVIALALSLAIILALVEPNTRAIVNKIIPYLPN